MEVCRRARVDAGTGSKGGGIGDPGGDGCQPCGPISYQEASTVVRERQVLEDVRRRR
jgi:hypothetical protein